MAKYSARDCVRHTVLSCKLLPLPYGQNKQRCIRFYAHWPNHEHAYSLKESDRQHWSRRLDELDRWNQKSNRSSIKVDRQLCSRQGRTSEWRRAKGSENTGVEAFVEHRYISHRWGLGDSAQSRWRPRQIAWRKERQNRNGVADQRRIRRLKNTKGAWKGQVELNFPLPWSCHQRSQ